jgi:hypothetical protein
MEPSLPGLDVPVQLRGTIIGFASLLPYLRLRPRWHAIEENLLQRPHVIRQACRHRWCTRPPHFGRPSTVGRLRHHQGPTQTCMRQLPLAGHEQACRDVLDNTRCRQRSGTAATGRHRDDHWPAGCAAPANRHSHTRGGGKSAWRCPPSGGGGSLAAWDRAVAEAREPSRPSLVHTGHSGACASGPRTLGARWNACAWA